MKPTSESAHYPFWIHIKNGGRVWRDDKLNHVREWLDLQKLDNDPDKITLYGSNDLCIDPIAAFEAELEEKKRALEVHRSQDGYDADRNRISALEAENERLKQAQSTRIDMCDELRQERDRLRAEIEEFWKPIGAKEVLLRASLDEARVLLEKSWKIAAPFVKRKAITWEEWDAICSEIEAFLSRTAGGRPQPDPPKEPSPAQ